MSAIDMSVIDISTGGPHASLPATYVVGATYNVVVGLGWVGP